MTSTMNGPGISMGLESSSKQSPGDLMVENGLLAGLPARNSLSSMSGSGSSGASSRSSSLKSVGGMGSNFEARNSHHHHHHVNKPHSPLGQSKSAVSLYLSLAHEPEGVICQICKSKLKEPKLLDCLHVYCKSCLAAISQLESDLSPDCLLISCPKCKQNTTVCYEVTPTTVSRI